MVIWYSFIGTYSHSLNLLAASCDTQRLQWLLMTEGGRRPRSSALRNLSSEGRLIRLQTTGLEEWLRTWITYTVSMWWTTSIRTGTLARTLMSSVAATHTGDLAKAIQAPLIL